MNSKKVIYCGELNVTTNIPIEYIVNMEISVQENKHATLWMKVINSGDLNRNIDLDMYIGEKIGLNRGTDKLFLGKIEKIIYYHRNGCSEMEVWSYSMSLQLDKEKEKCSFQDIAMTYEQVANKVIQKTEGAIIVWNERKGQKICYPLIQYEETKWDFLKRLASHFNTVLYPDEVSGEAKFDFGMHKGVEYDINDFEIFKIGFNNDSTKQNVRYLECGSSKRMRIGDYVIFQGHKYIISRIKTIFKNGLLVFLYLLQENGMSQKKLYNSFISGVYLQGIVIRTSKEHIYAKLDINKEETNLYGWPYLPVTGNMFYCMPEIGTNVMIYFPSCDETEGIAANIIIKDPLRKNVQEKEFATNYGKKICMYPEYMEFSTKIGKIGLSDKSGENIYCNSDIKVIARESIRIQGKHIEVIAPSEILCKTPEANIDLSRDINFYASAGVLTQGRDTRNARKNKPVALNEEESSWNLFLPTIAAIPIVDIFQIDENSILDLKACGSVAKFAEGPTIIAMQEVMAGKKESEVYFPQAFKAMQTYTVKGGYATPSVDIVKKESN